MQRKSRHEADTIILVSAWSPADGLSPLISSCDFSGKGSTEEFSLAPQRTAEAYTPSPEAVFSQSRRRGPERLRHTPPPRRPLPLTNGRGRVVAGAMSSTQAMPPPASSDQAGCIVKSLKCVTKSLKRITNFLGYVTKSLKRIVKSLKTALRTPHPDPAHRPVIKPSPLISAELIRGN